MADELEELLGSYKVEGADKQLLDTIMARVAEMPAVAKVVPFPARRQPWLAQAAMMAGVAVLGFWLGTGNPVAGTQAVTTTASSTAPSYFEETILGAHTIDEVML